jgi:hypothetical protein
MADYRKPRSRFSIAIETRLESTRPLVTLIAALDAFFQEHERCDDLDSGLDGDRVWMTCTCGAVIDRSADDD